MTKLAVINTSSLDTFANVPVRIVRQQHAIRDASVRTAIRLPNQLAMPIRFQLHRRKRTISMLLFWRRADSLTNLPGGTCVHSANRSAASNPGSEHAPRSEPLLIQASILPHIARSSRTSCSLCSELSPPHPH